MTNDCQETRSRFPDYLTGDLEPGALDVVKHHVSTCDSCQRELEELTSTWTRLEILPEEQPGPNLRGNFYTMLESYQEGLEARPLSPLGKLLEKINIKDAWQGLLPRRPLYQFAMVLALLAIGLSAGLFLRSPQVEKQQFAHLRQENQQVRRQLALTLLGQSSPSERLKGVNCSAYLEAPDNKLLETLLDTLDNDPNTNVRLSAVDALYLFADQPMVREGLVRSLQKQSSPLVQIALIDLMVQIREKQAVNSLKQLLENNKLNPEVKQRAQLSIKKLI
jgi:hypothetical protein